MSTPRSSPLGRPILPIILILWVALAGCAPPEPAASALRLPTRLPPTLTSPPTSTIVVIGAWDYYQEGLGRWERGDADGAIASFSRAILRSPDVFVSPYVARGRVYLSRDELRPALSDAQAAIDIDPDNAAAFALRGEVLRRLGHPQQALEDFDRMAELDADRIVDNFSAYWEVARETGQAVRMLTLSKAYSDAYPQDPLYHYYRGWAFIQLDSAGSAIKTLGEGIESSSNPPALLWFTLGRAYAEVGRWESAVTSFEATRLLVQAGDASLAIHTDRPIIDLFDNLGRAYLQIGRCADAETMLEYAISIGAPASAYTSTLEEARICLTPAPESTPYPTTTPG